MSSSVDQDELEEGELDDDGECDDVTQVVAEPQPANCVQDRIIANIQSLAEGSFSETDSRVDDNVEDNDEFEDVSARQFSARLHRQQRASYDRRKPERHRHNNDVGRGFKKELKVLENAAEDTCNDVDYRAPPRRSRNNIWSKTQSGSLPYDSPHTTSDDDGENPPASHSDRLQHPEEEENCAENSRVDNRNRSRRRHRRHRTSSTSRGIDSRDVDVSPAVRPFQNEINSSKMLPKSLLQSQSRKRKLVDTPMVERPVCKFFMDGKCVKGEECPFNHDCLPPKKPELCRFYMTAVCTKGKLCVYYHNDWPCKNFHRFGLCTYGDECKFSHEELSAETRKLLDMPCNFSEDNTQVQHQQHPTPTTEKRKIPSLLDIPTYLPGTAPKSSPPGTISHVDLSRFGYFDEDDESDSESNNTPGLNGKDVTTGSSGRGAVTGSSGRGAAIRRPPIIGRPRAIYIEDDEDEDQYNEEEDVFEERNSFDDDAIQRFIEKQRKIADKDAGDGNRKHCIDDMNVRNQLQNSKQHTTAPQHEQQERYHNRYSQEQLSGEDLHDENDASMENKTSSNSEKPDEDSSGREPRRVGDDNEQAMLAGNDEDYDEFIRLPVAQRQLFMRIRNNQRQQGFTEDKTDDPVVADGNNDDKWYSSDEEEQENKVQSVPVVSSVDTDLTAIEPAPATLTACTSQPPPPLLFNVPPPLLMPPLMPPRQTNPVLNMPPYGLQVPNVPPPLIPPPQQGMPPPSMGIQMHGMPPPHRLPPGPNMMGPPPMRPDLSPSLLGPGPRPMLPPGMMPPGHGLPPPGMLGGPAGNPGMMSQSAPHHGQMGLLGHGPHDALIRQGPVMGPSPQQPPFGPMPGTNLLGQNINLPQFDIGQILSAIRNNMTTTAPPSSTSADPLTGASIRDPRASTASVAGVVADPRIRIAAGLPPSDLPDTKVSSSSQPPESPSSPPSAVDNEVNVSGLRVAYLLRRLSINTQPLSIPSHVSLDELKERSDPRLQRYQHRASTIPITGVVRRQSSAGSPVSDTLSAGHQSPPLYTLPDIVLPPIPVRTNNDLTTATGSLRLPPSTLPKVPEALLERNSTLLSEPGLLFQRQLSNASSDSNNDASEPKKVIDYRNDPRYKKKKTLVTSRDESTAKRPRTSVGQSDDSFQETFRSGFYGTTDDDDRGIELGQYRSFGTSNEAPTDVGPNWIKEDRSVSPPASFNLVQPSSFMSLSGISSSGIAGEEEHVSLKDMFKTIDPTNSPFC